MKLEKEERNKITLQRNLERTKDDDDDLKEK